MSTRLTLTRAELDALPEYSRSLPTGTTIGKRWKRNLADGHGGKLKPYWIVGEYYDIDRDDRVGIRWYDVEITDADRPTVRPVGALPAHIHTEAVIDCLRQMSRDSDRESIDAWNLTVAADRLAGLYYGPAVSP